MATRTTTKTKPHKTAAAKKPVKAAVSHKHTKGKPAKDSKASPPAKSARPAHSPPKPAAPSVAEKSAPAAPPTRRAPAESISLIDKAKPQVKADRPEKVKSAVLPPISRIHESLKTSLPPVEKAEAPRQAELEQPAGDETATAVTDGETAEAATQKVIHIKPPIIVKQLATDLGLKPHQLIAELMSHNIFANINQTIEPDVASKIAESHGFVLEKERREKGAGVHKVEQP